MFTYLFGGFVPDSKTSTSKKNGMERIKISRDQPCELMSLENTLSTAQLKPNASYVRVEDKLMYINKKDDISVTLDIDPQQLINFDKEFKTSITPRKLTIDELKKITALTGHSQDKIYIQLLFSGYYVNPDRTAELKKLIENTPYNFTYHEIDCKPGWGLFSTPPDTTVEIIVPIVDIEKKREAFQEIKAFVEKWDPHWFPILQNFENDILAAKPPFQLTKDKNHIPILGITQNIDKILLSFLYRGKGMDSERTHKIDELLKILNYAFEEYPLSDTGSAIQISIMLDEITNETDSYKKLKAFVLRHDENMLLSMLSYEKNLKSERAFLSASHVF